MKTFTRSAALAAVVFAAAISRVNGQFAACNLSGYCGGSEDQITDIINTINANIEMGLGDTYYESGIAIACTRTSSSAGEYMCAYYTNGRSGDLNGAITNIQDISDANCPSCGLYDFGDGTTLNVDYSVETPCNVNNGVTTCTCDNEGDGHCLAPY